MRKWKKTAAALLCLLTVLPCFPRGADAAGLPERISDELLWEESWEQYWKEHPEQWQALESAPDSDAQAAQATETTLAAMRSRAEALINYRWTPTTDIAVWNGSPYNGLKYFPAGSTVKGVPYTLFTSEVVSRSLCSLEQYQAVASRNYSATAYCVSIGGTRTGPVYGSCCADLVAEVLGGNFMNGSSPRYHNVGAIWSTSYGTTIHGQKMEDLRPGDAISDYPKHSHIMWVGDVTEDSITVYEQTPPIARKRTLKKAAYTNASGYFALGSKVYSTVTRNNDFSGGEVPSLPQVTSDKSSYDTGSSVLLRWTAVEGCSAYRLRVDRDGTTVLDWRTESETSYTLTNAAAGIYTVYVSALNSAGSSGSSICSFSVFDRQTAVEAWFSTENMGDSSPFSWIGTPVYLCYRIYDRNSGELYGSYGSGSYAVQAEILSPTGAALNAGTFQNDSNSVSATLQTQGTLTGRVSFTAGSEQLTATASVLLSRRIGYTGWLSAEALGSETQTLVAGDSCCLNYRISDPDNGEPFNSYNQILDAYTVGLQVTGPDGSVSRMSFSNADSGSMSFTPTAAGEYVYRIYPVVGSDPAVETVFQVTDRCAYYGHDYQDGVCTRCGDRLNPFTDVKRSKYYYAPVLWAWYHDPQITGGTGAGRFGPDKTCTREQVMTFLWKAFGSPEPASAENPFTDVSPSKYYYKAVLWAAHSGLTGGVGGGRFGVKKSCTREQVVSFLWKAAGSPTPRAGECAFTDVNLKKYYGKAVLWAVESGVTGGMSATRFGVGKACTRAQVVTFLYAAMGKNE